MFTMHYNTNWTIMDVPLPYALSFQDAASVNATGLQILHDTIMFYLIVILIVVSYIGIRFLIYFSTKETHNGVLNRSLIDRHSIHGQVLELCWTITPAIILIMIALPSFRLLYLADEILDPTISVKAIGRQWYWTYEYTDYVSDLEPIVFDSYIVPDSDLENGDLRLLEVDAPLVLPIDTHIRLLTTSTDVIHSLGVPSLGLKADCIPGRLNQVSLYINRSSKFYGMCSELCGTGHAQMPIIIAATSTENYIDWLMSQ
jgi:cytochrome c oxidase subunit 2